MTVPLGRTVSAVAVLVGRAGMTGRTGARLTAGQAIARPGRAAVVTAGPAGHAGLTRRLVTGRAGRTAGDMTMAVAADDGGAVTTAGPGRARRAGAGRGLVTPGPPGPAAGPVLAGPCGYGPGAGGRPGGPGRGRPGRETAGTGGTGGPRSGGPAGEAGSLPYVPASITADQLDPEARAELRTLPGDLAEAVARQLIAASLAEDPEQAYRHAQAARQLAARVGVVRESVGIAAYRAGHWAEALAELRAARRLTGRSTYLPMMADSERALGRLDRALDLVTGPQAEEADRATRIELKIVESGIRRDQGLPGAAVVALQIPELTDGRQRRGSARLYYAYADALLDAGRDDEAREWFARAAGADTQGETDADERFDELDQLAIEDLQADEDEDEGDEDDGLEDYAGDLDDDPDADDLEPRSRCRRPRYRRPRRRGGQRGRRPRRRGRRSQTRYRGQHQGRAQPVRDPLPAARRPQPGRRGSRNGRGSRPGQPRRRRRSRRR